MHIQSNSALAELASVLGLPEDDIESYDIEEIWKNGQKTTKFILWLSQTSEECPHCGSHAFVRNGYLTRTLNHNICARKNWVVITKRRRMICKVCDKSFSDQDFVSYANRRMSMEVVVNVLEDLRSPSATFASVARTYGLSSPTVMSLFDAHANTPRTRLPRFLCLDENYAIRTDKSKYVLTMLDFSTGEAIDILPNRYKDQLMKYMWSIPLEEREQVEAVGIDMYPTYRDVVEQCMPNAVVVVDRFHLVKEYGQQADLIRTALAKAYKSQLNKITYELKKLKDKPDASSQIRRAEITKLEKRKKDVSLITYLLNKFSWMLSKDPNDAIFNPSAEKKYNQKLGYQVNYSQIREMLLDCDPVIRTIISYRQELAGLYDFTSPEDARLYFDDLVRKMLQENNPTQIRHFAKTMEHWKREILNSVKVYSRTWHETKDGDVTIRYHRLNNALIENRNHIIKVVKNTANGYSNFPRFRKRLLYVLRKNAPYNLYADFREKKNRKQS